MYTRVAYVYVIYIYCAVCSVSARHTINFVGYVKMTHVFNFSSCY